MAMFLANGRSLSTHTYIWRTRMRHLSKAEIAIIKARIIRGDKYVEIASDYRINQGRVADLKFGRIHQDIEPADLSQ
jgi:hypothetical protein